MQIRNKNIAQYLLLINVCFLPFAIAAQSTQSTTVNPGLSGLYYSKNPNSIQLTSSTNTSLLPYYISKRQDYSEIREKRTFTSKTFIGEDGAILMQYCSKNIHYFDKEKNLQPISAKLQPSENGWAAPQQEFPTYLFSDGSVALSSDEAHKIIFNKNCKINNQEINLSDFTVGENGMYIHNAIAGIDKKIVFSENQIKTDYIIHQLPNTNDDLIFSEEIELPDGYIISKEKTPLSNSPSLMERGQGGEVCVRFNGKEKTKFHSPLFYDANHNLLQGKYNLIQKNGKNILQFTVPAKWLNSPDRTFPVTIDPLVTGPVSFYPAIYLPSCEYPTFSKDSMLVTIPPGITITYFNIEDSYYADVMVGALMTEGYMMNSTSCGTVVGQCDSVKSGTCYWIPGQDFKNQLACCFTPSCDTQTFYLTHGFARTPAIYGTGCNQNAVYYTPDGEHPFSAYIEGRTVEIGTTSWSVYPTTVCSDSCTIFLKASAQFGVPPYTMTHPWSTDTITFGNIFNGCNTNGNDTIALRIPGCPLNCDTNASLSIPPPLIIDVCGDTVLGLVPVTITRNPVPFAFVNSVDNICFGETVNIPLSSCVGGTTYAWTGTNGSNGNGNISDVPASSGTVSYFIEPTANGCTGQITTVSVNVYPKYSSNVSDTICSGTSIFLQGGFQTSAGTYYDTLQTVNGCDSAVTTNLAVTINFVNADTAVCAGNSVFLEGDFQSVPGVYYDTATTPGGCDSIIVTTLNIYPLPPVYAGADVTVNAGSTALLNANGANNYVWNPGNFSGQNYSVTPAETIVYTVTGTDTNDCSSSDDVQVTVEHKYWISVPNIFSPNNDNENDKIYVHGVGIKEMNFIIFDRLGEKIFETKDKTIPWDGMYKGKQLNPAVFAYILIAVFDDDSEYKEKGNITLIR